MKLLLAVVAALLLFAGLAQAQSQSMCFQDLQALCPKPVGQGSCQSCVAKNIAQLHRCGQWNLEDFCDELVAPTFHQLPTVRDERTGLFNTEVPKCGSSQVNCWVQTAGEAQVTFLKQVVTSDAFPCRTGQSSTSFVVDSKVAINGGADDCSMEVKGFGGKTVSLGLCQTASRDGLYMGFDCPTGTGVVEATGPTNKCDGGFGSYTAIITCPQFEITTYIKF